MKINYNRVKQRNSGKELTFLIIILQFIPSFWLETRLLISHKTLTTLCPSKQNCFLEVGPETLGIILDTPLGSVSSLQNVSKQPAPVSCEPERPKDSAVVTGLKNVPEPRDQEETGRSCGEGEGRTRMMVGWPGTRG